MSNSATVLGVIDLKQKKDGSSESTAPQILSSPTFDSRIYPNYFRLAYPVIRELRRDPTVQLARWAVLAPMIHTPWMYEYHKTKGSKEMVDFLEDTFSPLRDELLTRMVFGTLDFGWMPFEICYKPEDGYIFIDNFKPLLHDYTTILVYTNTGQFAGFANETFGFKGSKLVHEQYAMNTNFETEGTDWYGFSVYDNLFHITQSWNQVQNTANRYDKKIAGALWVIYYPVGKTMYGGTLTDNDVIANSLLDKLEASGGVAVPDDIQAWMDDSLDREIKGAWRIELVSAKGSQGSAGFIDRQKYLDALKMRAFALTERSVLEGSHGTKAEADVHGDVSLSIVDSRHRLLASKLNITAVPKTLEMNFGKKYAYRAWIRPAPLVDNQFKTIKEIYTRIMSDGDALAAEVANIDIKALRDELGIPTGVGLEIEKEEKEQPKIGEKESKVTTEKVTENG